MNEKPSWLKRIFPWEQKRLHVNGHSMAMLTREMRMLRRCCMGIRPVWANSDSGGIRGLKEAVAVSAPVIRIEACGRRRKGTGPLSRREPGQSGVTAIPVVIRLVGFQLELEIRLAPKQCPVEKLSPYCPDQSLNESMRAGRAGNGLIS